MTKPHFWDLKTWLMLGGFLGFTSLGSLITFGRSVVGWFAFPTIDAAQARALGHQDSVNAVRFDSLQAWHQQDHSAIGALGGKVDTLAATVAEMPGASAAARRRRERESAGRALIGSRDLVDDRSSFRALKGERIP